MHKILMVDDDPLVLRANRLYFENAGYQVLCARNAEEAMAVVTGAALDCIVLDVKLPDENGFSLCRHIRARSAVPIIFLSCYTAEDCRVRGLELGADDYVCKPYSLRELELRVRLRIQDGGRTAQLPPLRYGPLVIDPARQLVQLAGQEAGLSAYEFRILYFLASHPGQVFTYEQIFNAVWQAPMNKGIKSLQMLIVRIRQKLDALCPAHEYIQTVRRQGYLFVPGAPGEQG